MIVHHADALEMMRASADKKQQAKSGVYVLIKGPKPAKTYSKFFIFTAGVALSCYGAIFHDQGTFAVGTLISTIYCIMEIERLVGIIRTLEQSKTKQYALFTGNGDQVEKTDLPATQYECQHSFVQKDLHWESCRHCGLIRPTFRP